MPKQIKSQSATKPKTERSNSGKRSSKPTGDLLGKGLETKFFTMCKKQNWMR